MPPALRTISRNQYAPVFLGGRKVASVGEIANGGAGRFRDARIKQTHLPLQPRRRAVARRHTSCDSAVQPAWSECELSAFVAGDGTVYGGTALDADDDVNFIPGVIFAMDGSGAVLGTRKFTPAEGCQLSGRILASPDGSRYALTAGGGSVGVLSFGAVVRIHPNGVAETLVTS